MEIRRKMQATIGEYDELLTLVWFFSHVSRSSGIAKTILQSTAKVKKEEVDRKRDEETLPALLGQLRIGQGGNGLLQSHVWCTYDLPRLWDRSDTGNKDDAKLSHGKPWHNQIDLQSRLCGRSSSSSFSSSFYNNY